MIICCHIRSIGNTFSILIGPQHQGLSTQRLQPKYRHNQHHTHWNNTLRVMKACSRSIYEMLVWLSFRGVWFSLTADAGWPTVKILLSHLGTYQGSNSWIMLSNRITANKRALKPANQARAKTKNTIKLFQPPGFDRAVRISPLEPASAILDSTQASHVLTAGPIRALQTGSTTTGCWNISLQTVPNYLPPIKLKKKKKLILPRIATLLNQCY